MDSHFVFPAAVMAFIVIVMLGAAIHHAYNLAQPIVTRKAKVTGKRTTITQHGFGQVPPHSPHWHGAGHFPLQTTYLCAFEFGDGQRAEFTVDANRYGLMAEGDRGDLDTQGTLFRDFRREIRQVKA